MVIYSIKLWRFNKFEPKMEKPKHEKEGNNGKSKASAWELLRHSDMLDGWLMMWGTFGCIIDGASTPITMLILSRLMNTYADNPSLTTGDINEYALYLLYLALAVGFGAFLEGFCWARTAERQTSQLRRKYLWSVLRQDVGFFDIQLSDSTVYHVVSTISTGTLTIQDTLSEKIPNFLMNMSTFFTSQIVALYLSWKLSLVTVPALCMLAIPGVIYGKMLMNIGKKIKEAYGVAGEIVEQAVSSIRTVYSFVGEHRTQEAFSIALNKSLVLGVRQGMIKGMTMGIVGIGIAVWAFQAWYGSVLVIKDGARGGNIFNAGICVIVGGLALGGALVNLKYFTEAAIVVSQISELVKRVPGIDVSNLRGETMEDVEGDVEFKDVGFSYPSRPSSMILQKFNLRIMAGKTVGLVGESGSGKSTVISLLVRFYSPFEGDILLDGKSIMSLQLKWLRSQIGLVSQEPILFATTIKENIMFGKEDATMELLVDAAKAANAHDFISKLPDGYNAQVGQFGIQMSGGQKQRIAIARALLKDPRILLLDEATSALDAQSEKTVQDALDQASRGRTTLIVAHRLSTLRNADSIAVLQSGKVVEYGSHDQLIQNEQGEYYKMVRSQETNMEDETPSPPEERKGRSPTDEREILNRSSPDRSLYHDNQMASNEEDDYNPPSLWTLLKMTSPEWMRTLLGCIGAIGFGAVQPVHSFCMGALVSVYFINDHDEIKAQTQFYCLIALSYGFFSFIMNVIQHYNFGVMGEHLTKRLREAMLAKVLSFEIGWFDKEHNTSGAISARFATQLNLVRSLVCDRLSLVAQVTSATIISIVMSLAISWRLAMVILSLQPINVGSFYAKGVLMQRMSKKVQKAQNGSSQLASEAVSNHRTITAFSSQEKIMGLFEAAQRGPQSESRKQSWYVGFGLLVSQLINTGSSSLIFWYGGHLIADKRITYKELFQTFFILITTGKVIAEAGSTTSDLAKGVDAIKSVFLILDRKSKMDSDDPMGIKPKKIQGHVELKEVDFSYPSRPKHMIFRSLNLKIEAGKAVALVGQSGSGKSTIIGLIERFYDPLRGSIEIDGVDIKSYNLMSLRTHIALVSQEPTLFIGTIRENIVYGKENATEAEMISAATLANAHEFISCMKDGYGTYCGERGIQLSGGQKQRIALARAILKDPTILLLDEATSALDSQSENLVQDAIEKMMLGRTCIIVAHRLATISKSESIAVIENGRVVEEGSHSELMAKGDEGSYFSLMKLQQDASKKQGDHLN